MSHTSQRTLQALADLVGAQLQGDGLCEISGLNTIQDAEPGQLAFLANPNYQKYLSTTRAAAVILKPELSDSYSGNKLLLNNPYLGYARLSALFDTRPVPSERVHPSACVDPSATLGAKVSVGANAVIEAGVEIGEGSTVGSGAVIGSDSRIGRDCLIHANATIYHGISIGDRVTLHSGCIIGADGFGFAPSSEGWVKVHQLGAVCIGNDVEIGAGTTVDRGALDDTVLADGVILDNQVQIAHNVRIGENTAIAGCTAVAGSTHIGKNCTIAGACGIVGHLTLCDGVHVTAMTLVTKSINQPGAYSSGTGMMPSAQWRKSAVRFGQLDKLAGRITRLEKSTKSQRD